MVVDAELLLLLLLLVEEDVDEDEAEEEVDKDVDVDILLFLPFPFFVLPSLFFEVLALSFFALSLNLLPALDLLSLCIRLFDLLVDDLRSEAIFDLPPFLDLLGGESDRLLVLERPRLIPSVLPDLAGFLSHSEIELLIVLCLLRSLDLLMANSGLSDGLSLTLADRVVEFSSAVPITAGVCASGECPWMSMASDPAMGLSWSVLFPVLVSVW